MIVAGVLVALVADEWRESLRDRASERLYIERLIDDVRADTAELSGALRLGSEKDGRLQRLIGLSVDALADDAAVRTAARDVANSNTWGWDYPTARRITFDELLSVGGLGLITEVGIREAISEYYWRHADTENRVEARRSDLPRLSYSLVVSMGGASEDANGDWALGSGTAQALREATRSGRLRHAATAELNSHRYLLINTDELMQSAASLLGQLEGYLNDDRQ